jgi:hypothetical protein
LASDFLHCHFGRCRPEIHFRHGTQRQRDAINARHGRWVFGRDSHTQLSCHA